MKKLLIVLGLFLVLFTGKANAVVTNCGAAPYKPTMDVTGNWYYTFVPRAGLTYHGTMVLVTCNGYVTGHLLVPDEITDPASRASWNFPLMGTESGTSVMLYNPPDVTQFDDPWWFDLRGTPYTGFPNSGTMIGEEYAGMEHNDRGVLFSAGWVPGQPNRIIVPGADSPMPCPSTTAPTIGSLPGWNLTPYSYAWGSGWTGTLSVQQYGAWLFMRIEPPVQLPPGQPWNWPMWGFIYGSSSAGYGIWVASAAGEGYTDPWWFNLNLTAGPPIYMNGTGFGYACHNYAVNFSAQ